MKFSVSDLASYVTMVIAANSIDLPSVLRFVILSAIAYHVTISCFYPFLVKLIAIFIKQISDELVKLRNAGK